MAANPPVKVVELTRLRPDVYAGLEKQVAAPYVDRQTTEIQAGFLLGIQHVLKVLRDGYVV